MKTAAQSQVEIEVRYAETDQMGVVHHAAYLVWFELARTHHCAQSGFRYFEIEQLGYYLMVTGMEVRYRRGARYGDSVGVRCGIEQMTSRTLRFAYAVTRDGGLLATGASDHLWVDRTTGKPCRIPEVLRAPFRRLAGAAD